MSLIRVKGLALAFIGFSCLGMAGCAGDSASDSTMEGTGGTAVVGPDMPDIVVEAGRVVVPEPLHRLNRLEYNNTVRDLLGADSRPADSFPPDSALDGFDNLAEGLALTPSLFNAYADTARDLSSGALELSPRFYWRKFAKDVATGGFPVGSTGWSLYGSDISVPFELTEAEAITINVMGGGTTSNAPTPIMSLHLDGAPINTFTVDAPVAVPETYSIQANLAAGAHTLLITFDNFQEDAPSNTVNTLVLRTIEIASEATAYPPSRALIQTCDPTTAPDEDACYTQILSQFARRAWRRTLTPDETLRLITLWQQLSVGEGKEAALALAIRTLLITPQFLYRASLPEPTATGDIVPLSQASLASRLSYFLWSSMPDDALLDLVDAGTLQNDEILGQTLRRMLADPKAAGLLEGFAAQYMAARKLRNAAPNAEIYPDFDEPLRDAMIQETKLFFGDFLTNQLPLGSLLTPDFNYVNDRLARHYGLPEPGSDALVRVALPPGTRGGLIMQGAWLTAQSEPDRTSPVLRGRFLVEQTLCIDVPPPPADVSPIIEAAPDATIRERLELHRASPRCAACHNILDPPGLGLEEFDGIGRQRDTENGLPINTTGSLPAGPDFAGGVQLAELIKQDPRFYSCFTDKLMTYALGRRLVEQDDPFSNDVAATLDPNVTTLDQMIEQLVLSPVFRMRSMTVPGN